MRLFIFGAGFSGRVIGRAFAGEAAFVGGTTRSSGKAAALRAAGIAPFLFDGALSTEAADALKTVTHLVASAAPGEAGDPVLAAARDAIVHAMPALEWIGYLSTIGVYGDQSGGWVAEDGALRPSSARAAHRVAAEREWTLLGEARGTPVAALRLSGIYGPGRNAFVNLASGTARRIVKQGQVFNRIHVEDIAGAASMLAAGRTGGVFNVTDDEPAPPQDVVAYAARLMGVEPPPEVPFEQAEMTPMARSFYADNKRVSNAHLKAAGYRFRFPDYRAALDDMWRTGSWSGEG